MITRHEYYDQDPVYLEEVSKVTNPKGYTKGVAGNGRSSLFVDWKPKKEDVFAESDGKILVMHFDKWLKDSKFGVYNNFSIKKNSYEKKIDYMTDYINFFTTFYDEDREFIMGYLKVKFELDNRKKFNEDNSNAFIDFLYDVIITPKFVARITRMVEDNYIDDIEGDDEETDGEGKGKYIKGEVKHLESLEFTNQHVKILLKISHTMKLISPLIFQYAYLNTIKLNKDNDLIYRAYRPLFDIMSENVNIYNKLVVYARAKVLENKAHNPTMYEQRDIFGNDEAILMNDLVKKVLITNNVFKFDFPNKWSKKEKKFRENIVGFLKTVLKYQLLYFLKQQHDKTLTEVTNSSNEDGLSNMDKMRSILNKINEGDVIISSVNCERTLEYIKKNFDITITDEEIEYYRLNHKPSQFQTQLVSSFWCRYFGSYRDTYNLTRREYVYLALLLKKLLLIMAGYPADAKYDGGCVLPFLLTGNVSEKANLRLIRNTKFVTKVEESEAYKTLMKEKYSYLEEVQPNAIMGLLSQMINTTFTFVCYEDQDLLGKEIDYNEDLISDEMINFITLI